MFLKRYRRVLIFSIPAVAVLAAFLFTRVGRITVSAETARVRQELFSELRPVSLRNCSLKRFGHPRDGGYLLCDNLLDRVRSGYSYGIEGRDEWGCDLARRCGITVHQYDCFDLTRPVCQGGRVRFHAECIGAEPAQSDGRVFDTLAQQIAANGDGGKKLVVKMDVEGAEWASLLTAPEEVLADIDQLVVEFHEFDSPKYVQTVRRLKGTFHVVNVHFNNNACSWLTRPFPAWAYEVLLVNKRVGELDPDAPPTVLAQPLNARNIGHLPDCQASW
ncbi:MAG: hypothetical protein HY901_07720 [Deltaproteobacteria bacterium]|nr:hypothetical protein [Deltaproteobacteria bacterium]